MEAQAVHSDSRILIMVKDFLEDVFYRRYSPKTVDVYNRALSDFASFLAKQGIFDAQSVQTKTMEDYQKNMLERRFEPASVSVYLRAIKRLFAYLESKQRIFSNPTQELGPFRFRRKLLPVPSEEDIRILLAAPDTSKSAGIRDRALLEVLYSTGARVEEMQRLRIDDIDLETGTVRLFGKGSKQRVVPLGAEAISWLKRYITEVRCLLARNSQERMMWIGPSRKPFSKQMLYKTIQEYSHGAGLPVSVGPHAVRRACATHMLNHGANPVQIQMLLGHSSMRHLSQYLRLSIREIRDMHARSRLGQ